MFAGALDRRLHASIKANERGGGKSIRSAADAAYSIFAP
jgi:hypothetical protein